MGDRYRFEKFEVTVECDGDSMPLFLTSKKSSKLAVTTYLNAIRIVKLISGTASIRLSVPEDNKFITTKLEAGDAREEQSASTSEPKWKWLTVDVVIQREFQSAIGSTRQGSSDTSSFYVVCERHANTELLFGGKQYTQAKAAYANAIRTILLLQGTATVRLIASEMGNDVGYFETALDHGVSVARHVPYGSSGANCGGGPSPEQVLHDKFSQFKVQRRRLPRALCISGCAQFPPKEPP
jgi:hypothetical protein